MRVGIGHLCEGKPCLVVDFEDLLDGVDVGGRPDVQAQVVLACCTHDLLERQRRTCVIMMAISNNLRGTGHFLLADGNYHSFNETPSEQGSHLAPFIFFLIIS